MRNFTLLFLIIFSFLGCSGNKIAPYYIFDSTDKKELYINSYNNTLKLWDVPFEEIDVETNFGIAHVIICGPKSGEPLVLFHGTDASSTMWFPNVREFSKEYRVYAIDFPLEAGKSVSNRIKLTNKQTALFYNEVFTHFQMKNINLIGISRGGWLVTYLALQHSTAVKKIVLLSPAQTFGYVNNIGKVLSGVNLKMFPSTKSTTRFFNAFSHTPDKINTLFREQLYLAYKYGNSRPRLLNMWPFSKEELKSLQIPVLLLVGDHDIVNDQKTFVKARKYIPNIETAVIKDAGHFLSMDQPDSTNKIIVEFLNKKQ